MFLTRNPPMVLFLACLLAFACSTLALYLRLYTHYQLPNPDVLSWSTVLDHLSQLEFCLQGGVAEVPIPSASKDEVDIQHSASACGLVDVHTSLPFPSRYESQVRIGASLLARHLPFEAAHHIVQMKFGSALPASQSAYVHLIGPAHIMSDLAASGPRSPPNCTLLTEETDSGNVLTVLQMKARSTEAAMPYGWCSGPSEQLVTLRFESQPDWNVLVSPDDLQTIEWHLGATTIALFLMFVAGTVLATVLL